MGLEGEVLVRPQVVDPEGPGPRRLAGGLAFKEQDVSFDALRVENARRQTKERVDLTLVKQLPADRLAGAALEQDVVRDYDRRAAVRLQQRFDVLQEVELLVAGGGP